MAKRYWELPSGTIKEGMPSYGMLNDDTTDYAIFEDNRIIINGLSNDKSEFGVLIHEGKFSYPNGEAKGQLKKIIYVGLERGNGRGSGQNNVNSLGVRGSGWIATYSNLPEIDKPLASPPSNVTKFELYIPASKSLKGENALRQIAEKLGNSFKSSTFSPLKSWVENPYDLDLKEAVYTSSTYTNDDPSAEKSKILIATLEKSYDITAKPDAITNFNPKTQKIRIDSDPFGISGDYEVDFKIAKSTKQLKKLQKSDFNLIYNRKDGSLYYNVNREEVGFGDRGGLIAVLDPKLPLTGANFEIF